MFSVLLSLSHIRKWTSKRRPNDLIFHISWISTSLGATVDGLNQITRNLSVMTGGDQEDEGRCWGSCSRCSLQCCSCCFCQVAPGGYSVTLHHRAPVKKCTMYTSRWLHYTIYQWLQQSGAVCTRWRPRGLVPNTCPTARHDSPKPDPPIDNK